MRGSRMRRPGFGLADLPQDRAEPLLADGRLIRVLADRCPSFPGYHLDDPSRRLPTRAFTLLLEALRDRTGKPARTPDSPEIIARLPR